MQKTTRPSKQQSSADYEAQSAVERELVLRLASVLWRLRRATNIETGLFEIQAEHLANFTKEPRSWWLAAECLCHLRATELGLSVSVITQHREPAVLRAILHCCPSTLFSKPPICPATRSIGGFPRHSIFARGDQQTV